MQNCADLVDLDKFCIRIQLLRHVRLQKLASMWPRKSRLKFDKMSLNLATFSESASDLTAGNFGRLFCYCSAPIATSAKEDAFRSRYMRLLPVVVFKIGLGEMHVLKVKY